MKLEKAIEIKEADLKNHRVYYDPDLLAADKLSLEALKLYMALKATGSIPKGFSGIGETED